jgi:predicted HTH transcriptional regulator
VATLSDHERAQVASDLARIGAPDLFSQPPAQRHSDTSVAAAESVATSTTYLRGRVFEAIREHEALTDEQITKVTGIPANTARPRRVELMQAGAIKAVGKSRTASGRHATAWGIAS